MISRDLKIRCDAPGCVRGVVHGRRDANGAAQSWALPCLVCEGRGSVSLEALCKRIGECETTMRKLLKKRPPAMRAKVAARICGKLVDLMTPTTASKQKEMFT